MMIYHWLPERAYFSARIPVCIYLLLLCKIILLLFAEDAG